MNVAPETDELGVWAEPHRARRFPVALVVGLAAVTFAVVRENIDKIRSQA